MEIIIGIIAFILGVLFTRWVFKIDEIIQFQSKQYRMLRQIASKLGVTNDRISEIDDPAAYYRNKKAAEKAAKKASA